MNKDELVGLISDARKYTSRLVIEARPEQCLNSVRCTVVEGSGADAKTTSSIHERSDDFFAANDKKFDIVLVDGAHVCVQVLADIEHAVAALKPGGTVVVHGCVPPDHHASRPVSDFDANTRDTYRAVAWYFAHSPYLCYTIEDDFGLAVIDTTRSGKPRCPFPHRYMCDLTFEEFFNSRTELMNIVSRDTAVEFFMPGPGPADPAGGGSVGGLELLKNSGPTASGMLPAVPEGVFVAPILNCRTGNNLLQVYRGFWFAAVHGIPIENVKVRITGEIQASPALFSRIQPNLVTDDQLDMLPFAVLHCCPGSMSTPAVGRRVLYDLPLPERGAVAFTGSAFLYPELPWERSLFVHLFDNPEMRIALANELGNVLCGNTVGYQIRRGDFQFLSGRRRLTEEAIISDLSTIVRKHYGMVKIIVTSDDQGFVERLLWENGFLRKYVFHYRDPSAEKQLYLLSMCDYVIANGQYQCTSCWVNDPQWMGESTFGQIAQLLNRSYKFASHPCVPPSRADGQNSPTRNGCDCPQPTVGIAQWN